MRYNESTPRRFWAKVNKTPGCWLWTASTNGFGYGSIWTGYKLRRAHRFSWLIHNGDIPDGIRVLHKCDVPQCVRPSHLFLGTDIDNIVDKLSKGRGNNRRGSDHPGAKITESQVVQMRIERERGTPLKELETKYGLSNGEISLICNRKKWRHI